MCGEHRHKHHNHHDEDECRCRGGRPRHFMRPCLLLLLSEGHAHGYELMEKLGVFGFEPDPGAVYRHLRRMEAENLVLSEWETESAGPAKRIYKITDEGKDLLDTWTVHVIRNKQIMEDFLSRYDKQSKRKDAATKGGK